MQALRLDLNRLYEQRSELVGSRWQFEPREYADALRHLNARIRGLEQLICNLCHDLGDVFDQSETGTEE